MNIIPNILLQLPTKLDSLGLKDKTGELDTLYTLGLYTTIYSYSIIYTEMSSNFHIVLI
jgi:hypothetical protein